MIHIRRINEMAHKNNETLSRRANAHGRALNEWGSFGDDTWLDFFDNITGLSEIYKFDKLCPDTELTDNDVEQSFSAFCQGSLTNIGKGYCDAIFSAFVREIQEEYSLSDDEAEDIQMSFNPLEFHYGRESFTTKEELVNLINKRRSGK